MTNTKITKAELNKQLKEVLQPIKRKAGRVKGLKMAVGDYEIWERVEFPKELLVIKIRAKGNFTLKFEKAQAVAANYTNVVVEEL